jgi:hypothetical protein
MNQIPDEAISAVITAIVAAIIRYFERKKLKKQINQEK